MSKSKIVKLFIDGDELDLEVKESSSILDAALENDIDLPYSCQSGVCTACMAQLKNGEVDMEVSDGLSDEEIEEGYILCCQAIPITDNVEIDID
jgi:ring-1,2-phenylacetyl-CoA epoxidase subunit PaaE